ncbi:hypothetical protein GQX74_003306 [Glossina fuscipes]|nr:hypothetical protein GQX74_003306 [Glossina fuscipes]
MWKYCVMLSAVLLLPKFSQTLAEYSMQPSQQVEYYHYPSPPPPSLQTTVKNQLSRQTLAVTRNAHFQPNKLYRSVQNFKTSQSYQKATANELMPPTQSAMWTMTILNAQIARQFASPALDHMAFTMALAKQGYAPSHPAINSAATSLSTNVNAVKRESSIPAPSASLFSKSTQTLRSLNVKLPLPFGITPLNIGPLPLQTGAPYSSLPKAYNSYGYAYLPRK